MEILALNLAYSNLSSFREMAYPVISFLPPLLNIAHPGGIGSRSRCSDIGDCQDVESYLLVAIGFIRKT
jgi:hypothetical protein